MKERNLGRYNHGGNMDLDTGRGRQWVATRRGKAGTTRLINSFGPPGMGGKRRREVVAGGQERHPGGRSLCDHAREEWGRSG